MSRINQNFIDDLRSEATQFAREMAEEQANNLTLSFQHVTPPADHAPQHVTSPTDHAPQHVTSPADHAPLPVAEYEHRGIGEEHPYRRYLRDAKSMLLRPAEAIESLLEPLLPRSGVVALVGSSDSGKSTLLRGLAMAVAEGRSRYLGFELRPLYRRAIYVSTEDDEAAVGVLMQRQIAELGTTPSDYEGLSFIFDSEELLPTLDNELRSNPADVVIVDAFADLYHGALNENNRVRSFLNAFSTLAVRHNTLFVFLHHTGKRTESLTPSKHNAIGSQGFEAKMRLMLELRADPEDYALRHLCVVKGNYLPSEYKHDSYVLRFTEGLNFVATGERVPFDMLRERDPEREAAAEDKVAMIRAMREEGKTYQQIAADLGYKSHATVMKILKKG